MIGKIGRGIPLVAALITIVQCIFWVKDIKDENRELKKEKEELEREVQELQGKLESAKSAYHNLLVTLITKGKVSIRETESFLHEEEVKKIEKRVSKSLLSLAPRIPHTEKSVIKNSGFEEEDLKHWVFEDHHNVATFSRDCSNAKDGKCSAHIDIKKRGKFFEVQLKQFIPIVKGEEYFLTFWAKSSIPDCPLHVQLCKEDYPWTGYGLWKDFFLSTEWKQFTFWFQTTYTDTRARFTFHLGDWASEVWIDEVKLVKEKESGE
jgi:hypothetical protein